MKSLFFDLLFLIKSFSACSFFGLLIGEVDFYFKRGFILPGTNIESSSRNALILSIGIGTSSLSLGFKSLSFLAFLVFFIFSSFMFFSFWILTASFLFYFYTGLDFSIRVSFDAAIISFNSSSSYVTGGYSIVSRFLLLMKKNLSLMAIFVLLSIGGVFFILSHC